MSLENACVFPWARWIQRRYRCGTQSVNAVVLMLDRGPMAPSSRHHYCLERSLASALPDSQVITESNLEMSMQTRGMHLLRRWASSQQKLVSVEHDPYRQRREWG